MSWIYLFIAGLFEIGFALSFGHLKNTSGARWVIGSMIMVFCLAASLSLLFLACKRIPIGTAYAVWTGIGARGTVLATHIILREPVQGWRMLFLCLLVVSVIGLRLTNK